MIEEGRPFTLSSDHIALTSLIDPSLSGDDIVEISAFCQVPPRPASLIFYADDDSASSYPLHVELKTIREGADVLVRSNAAQKAAPVVFEMEFLEADPLRNCKVKITPQFVGKTVRQAVRGARFLRRLSETKLIGIAEECSDFEDASFTPLDDWRDVPLWQLHGGLFDAIDAICRLFGINPIVTDDIDNPDFICSMIEFGSILLRREEETNGSISFGVAEESVGFTRHAIARESISLVIDQGWRGNVFGVHCEADMRITAKGVLELAEPGTTNRFKITGAYRIYVQAASASDPDPDLG
ncbi:MAG: hypothetical protein U0M51_01755 [Eggerthellaceae bacterium]